MSERGDLLSNNLLLTELCSDFGEDTVAPLLEASKRWMNKFPNGNEMDWPQSMILYALSQLDEEETHWTFIATRIHLHDLYARYQQQYGTTVYLDFAAHVTRLVALGVYDPILLDKYSWEELLLIGKLIDPKRDQLFTYAGLKTMLNSYIALDPNDNQPVELPQERWLIIAMTLMQNETEQRLEKIAEAYWAMSHLYITFDMPSQKHQHRKTSTTYLDVYHKDIFHFLEAPSFNPIGQSETGFFDKGICIPDLFMEQVDSRGYWHLFDPNEVQAVMGYSLQDFYDEERGSGSFRDNYLACVNHPELTKETVFAVDLMKCIMRNQLATGFPHLFYKDEANRKNSNKHTGMIYPTTVFPDDYLTDQGSLMSNAAASSINLGRAVPAGALVRLIPIQVRMLDNAIDMHINLDTQCRGILLGTIGWHHLLALKKIRWETTEAVDFADKLYEKIAYLTISASAALAKEKGAYPAFRGSDWHTGAYFKERNYNSQAWKKLQANVMLNGVRNGYLTAVTSNPSAANLVGSTCGIEPIIEKSYLDKQLREPIPVIVPDLTSETLWFYKSGYFIDQQWTLKQNAARQRHVDQYISLNLHVHNSIQATELLDLHMNAWKSGLKMTNSIRSSTNFSSFLNNAISF